MLILLIGAVTWAQAPDRPTIFPSDSRDPRQAGGAELLEAVCPRQVAIDKKIGCATGCSDDTNFGSFGDRLPWSLEGVIRGHFLSPTSDDAVLWMTGCEPHAANFGGTILLTRKGHRWSMLWYKSAIQTEKCHKTRLTSGREILVCIGTAGAQGNNWTELYIEDLLEPKPTLMAGERDDGAFFAAADDTPTCGWQQGAKAPDTDPVIRSHIDKVEFSTRTVSGAPMVSVTASFGKKKMTLAEVEACLAEQRDVLPSTKTYRMDFLYDGRRFKPAPSSVEAVRIFEAR